MANANLSTLLSTDEDEQEAEFNHVAKIKPP
ncbi:hypothetical protein GQ600_4951 [Phytophthora cactorum]|nr:hypothetical protein GQ600_4951 [Phytophthora cactorum]